MNKLFAWPLRALSILLFALSGSTASAQGQQFSISGGDISTCSGVLEDTGGPTGEYGNNENFTVTICPDNPGDAISLNWVFFALSTQGPNPLDRIRLWDGDNTTATFLGEYTGSALQGLITSATNLNATGCLTVQFISNGGGTGNFAAGITCFTPCERPTAVATMSQPMPYPALVCVGEEISFDGTASYAAPGFNVTTYSWLFDDGDTVHTPTATHSFSVPGEYIVQLNLIDDNGCVNSNVVDLQVLVSTTPSFAGTLESLETCLGSVVDLTAVVQPVTWTGIPEANFGSGVYLPDDLGIPFTSDLTFTQFDPGQTVTSTSDILSVCVNMEHSYMGDLVIQLSCPNGQTMLMHQQGGGGTFLGDANDGDSNANPVPGICWNYCWSPTATLGTWAESANSGATPNVMPSSQGTALVPDTYTPVQSFTNMIGCPLNGTWTFTITDLWGADNGFLCDWSMNFDPNIIPDATQFTPVLGTSSIDSSGWTGPSFVPDPNDPLFGQATLDTPGSYDYTFSVTDNFGCSYDTTINVTILPQMVLDAGPGVTLCNDSLPMAAEITANGPPNSCMWTIDLYDTWGDGWNGNGAITVTVDGVSTNYTNVSGGGTDQTVNLPIVSGAAVTITYTPGSFNNENSFTLFNDAGGVVYASPSNPAAGLSWTGIAVCGGGAPVTFDWTPTNGLGDPGDPHTMVWVTTPTWYFLSVYPTGSPECAVSDSVLVTPPPSLNPGTNAAITICPSSPNFLMTDSLGGTPDLGGVWTDAAGTVQPDNFIPATAVPDIYSYTYTVTSTAGCIATSQLDITVIPDTDPTCCGMPDAGPDNYSCDLSIVLNATPGNTGVGQWFGPPGSVFADVMEPHTTVTMPAGGGGAHWFYWRENDGAFCNTVDSVEMTFTDPMLMTFTTTDATCYSYCDGNARVSVAGGNAAVDFTYAWSSGNVSASPDSINGLCVGTYILLVTDDNGCTATDSLVIQQPVLLEIDSLVGRPVTCSGDCDGQIEVYDPEAVEYSFDDGNTWSASSLLPATCEGLYHAVIRNVAGCVGADHIVVTGPPPVIADFVWGPIPATVEAPTIYFHNTSTSAERYHWDIAGMAYSTLPDTSFLFTNTVPGVYPVCLIAYNYNDCPDTTCYDVTIEDILEPYVPNAFTPNGDGNNDGFFMSTNGPTITDFEMLIYDRWGQQVFSTEDPHEEWLGSYKNGGKILSTGVYVYRIRFEVARTQTKRELMGYVTLLK